MVRFFRHNKSSYAKFCESATIRGMVMIENRVVVETRLTDKVTSLSNFVANIVVVAADGAEVAITEATSILPLIPHKYIKIRDNAGIISNLNPMDR